MLQTIIGICILISALVCCYFGDGLVTASFESQYKSELWFIVSLITMLGFILIGKVVYNV